jgi:hypothetical protein
MHTLGAEFYLELHSLTAGRDVLGKKITVERHPIRYQIDLPTTPDSFTFDRVEPMRTKGESVADPREYDPSSAAVLYQGAGLVEIRLIRIWAAVDSDLTVDSHSWDDPASAAEASRIFNELYRGSLELARQFCMVTSVSLGQYWIEPSGEYPRIVNLAGLLDFTAMRSFGMKISTAGVLRIVTEESVMSSESLRMIGKMLDRVHEPLQSDEVLLGEAQHLIHSIPRPVAAPDRSTLLAAIALELRIKRVFQLFTSTIDARRHETYTHDRFLNLVKRNLMGADALAGRALAARVQSLFEARHLVAHDGTSIETANAKRHVATAREAFTVLQQLESDQRKLMTAISSALNAYIESQGS